MEKSKEPLYHTQVKPIETSMAYLQAAARVPMLMSCTLKLPVIISDKSFALPKLLPRDFAFYIIRSLNQSENKLTIEFKEYFHVLRNRWLMLCASQRNTRNLYLLHSKVKNFICLAFFRHLSFNFHELTSKFVSFFNKFAIFYEFNSAPWQQRKISITKLQISCVSAQDF